MLIGPAWVKSRFTGGRGVQCCWCWTHFLSGLSIRIQLLTNLFLTGKRYQALRGHWATAEGWQQLRHTVRPRTWTDGHGRPVEKPRGEAEQVSISSTILPRRPCFKVIQFCYLAFAKFSFKFWDDLITFALLIGHSEPQAVLWVLWKPLLGQGNLVR